ncbi:MAG TPA: OmpW family outer membrane protein, partial [Rhizomicrobium sp.]|nr:OmpW family outer membrane protein [Rhizomicrobium sp.]
MQFARIFAGLLLGAVSLTPAVAQTDTTDTDVAGHFQFRMRGVAVIPEASGTITVAGKPVAGSLSVTDSFIPEVDATYFITDHIGVEAIAGTTQHSPHYSSVGDLGSVWLLPP